MPAQSASKIADPTFRASVLEAMRACIARGRYPSAFATRQQAGFPTGWNNDLELIALRGQFLRAGEINVEGVRRRSGKKSDGLTGRTAEERAEIRRRMQAVRRGEVLDGPET